VDTLWQQHNGDERMVTSQHFFFIREDKHLGEDLREDPAAPSTLVSAIMLVTRADPSTPLVGDYVGNAS
jgi:hypothetical protein